MTTYSNPREAIMATAGQIFSIDFIKKDGSLRTMRARLGVKKSVTGKGYGYTPADNLITVYDMENQGFRFINTDTIKKFTCGNIVIEGI